MARRKNNMVRNIATATVIFLVVAAAFAMFTTPFANTEEVSIADVANKVKNDEVTLITVKENKLEVELKGSDTMFKSVKENDVSLAENLERLGVPTEKIAAINIAVEQPSGWDYFLRDILPTAVLSLIVLGVFFWFMMRAVQGQNNKAMSFGQSGARRSDANGKNRVTFKDVAGLKEAKVELFEIVEFLKSPAKFLKLGAKIPKGVLLLGPPGTGKTLLARAIAGEAQVPFFHISGSEFVEMFVGVGASRVRDLFKQAKKSAPAIVFVDEIDAVGRQRGTGLGGSHDEREQTLNQILVEMDGFDTHTNVIVVAATNRPDVLDPALLRPGRFDRRVTIDLPDIKEREAILKVHSRKKPLASDVNLKVLAQRTPGFSGADLENLLNEAAIMAARANGTEVTMGQAVEAIEKVMLGPERKSHVLDADEKKVTAFHEGGHALVSHVLPGADPVHKVSIISRGRAAGYTLNLPDRERKMKTKHEYLDELAVLMGGYAAEKQVFGDITTGASNDLQRATKLARRLITEFGMSNELGPMTFGQPDEWVFLGKELTEQRDYGEKMQEKIDKEVRDLLHNAHKVAIGILINHRQALDAIATTLIKNETIETDDFNELMKKEGLPKEPAKSDKTSDKNEGEVNVKKSEARHHNDTDDSEDESDDSEE